MEGVFLDLATVDHGDLDLSPLREALPRWRMYARPEGGLVEAIGDAAVVVTNKQRLDAGVLRSASRLRLICLAATGTDNVDLATAAEQGIAVSNIRDYCTASVVEQVFALLLALSRRLPEHTAAVRRGDWARAGQFSLLDYPFAELHGRCLGIVGHGTLGGAVGAAARAFGMEVLVARRPGGRDDRPERLPLEALLQRCDVLSLHCPLTPATRGLIGERELARMKPGAILINTARGALVDGAALLCWLRDGRLGGAGIDVLPEEPPPASDPLASARLDNLLVTPHVAWASSQARQRAVDAVAANIRAWRDGRARNRVEG
ncbi:MAG TPA: NAD(P)-dependent oxidoreductase [Gammaproteobacteria bacterium]|nr:NAD(P)-dependent oxidoreductase [Gammaproteobacteria bacterium]